MMNRNANSFMNGTAALKMPGLHEGSDEATIIAFPVSRRSAKTSARTSPVNSRRSIAGAKRGVRRVLDSSEMYCSLKYESFSGVPYGLFTKQGVAALSIGATAIGIVSLILGA